jgi:hypothetical protein
LAVILSAIDAIDYDVRKVKCGYHFGRMPERLPPCPSGVLGAADIGNGSLVSPTAFDRFVSPNLLVEACYTPTTHRFETAYRSQELIRLMAQFWRSGNSTYAQSDTQQSIAARKRLINPKILKHDRSRDVA